MVEFYRKTAVRNFAEMNNVFSDLYDSEGGLNYGRIFKVDGVSGTQSDYGYSSIKGGSQNTKGFFRTNVADRPPFGTADLKRMDGYIFIEDVIMDGATTLTPSLKFYKVKNEAVPDSLTTGLIRLRENTTRTFGHLSAISSTVEGFISDSESFTGEDNKYAYDGQVAYTSLGRKVRKASGGLWLELQDAYAHARSGTSSGDKIIGRSWPSLYREPQSFRGAFGDMTGGTDNTGERRKVIFIEKHTKDLTGGSGEMMAQWRGVKTAYGARPYFIDSEISNLIKSGHEEVIESDNNYNNQITTNNTFFDVVKHDRELTFEPDGMDPMLIGSCLSRFSTENLLRGDGQSMEMFAYWEGDNRVDDTASVSIDQNIQKMKQLYKPFSNPDSDKYNDTQETFVSYGPVPFAAHMFPGFYGEHGVQSSMSVETHIGNNEIERGSQSVAPVTASKVVFHSSGTWNTTGISPWTTYYVSETAAAGGAGWYKLTTDPKGATSGDITLGGSADTNLITYSQYTDVTSDFGGHSNGTIEIDVNLKNLDAAQCYTDSVDKISLVKRAFIITFGYHKPNAEDTIMSYIDRHTPFSALSDTNVITTNNTDFPFVGWSFFRTKGSGDDWLDGIHVVDSSKWLLNKDYDDSAHYDIYMLESDDTDGDGNPVVDNSVVPADSYFTFKVHAAPCTGTYNDNFAWGLHDPESGDPLPFSNRGTTSVDISDYNEAGTTHFSGTRFLTKMWWTGRTGCNATSGLDFWTQATSGGIDYFTAGGPTDALAIWPRYLTVWLTNFPNSSSVSNEDKFLESDGGEQSVTINTNTEYIRRPTTSSVFIDGIRLRNFNFNHENATVPDEGIKTSTLQVPAGTSSYGNWNALPFWSRSTNLPGSTTLCFGTDEYTDFVDASNAGGIFLNGFETNLGNNVAKPFHNIRASMTTDYHADYYGTSGTIFANNVTDTTVVEGGESFFGNQCRTSHIGGGAANNVQHDSCFLLDQSDEFAHALIIDTGTGSVDSFTNKGFIKIKGSIESAADVKDTISTNEPNLTRRECIFTSARVLKVANKSTGIFKVDTVEPFKGHENDTFIAYLYGSAFREVNHGDVGRLTTSGGDANTCNTTVKLISIIDKKHVQLSWNGTSNEGYDMISEKHIPYLMISPLKYWIYLVISNYTVEPTPTAGNVAGRWPVTNYTSFTYNSAILTRAHSAGAVAQHYGTFGMTYNEFLYKDAPTITGSYENAWDHDVIDEGGILEFEDWGFGDFNADTNEGGFCSKDIPKVNVYNAMRMPAIFEAGSDLEAGDEVDFMLTANENAKHEVIYHNNLESAGSGAGADINALHTSRLPYFVTVFEDDLPDTPILTVKPYEKDPFLPEFTFEASDDDLWYGFIIIDNKPVNSQYHGGIFHLPLNETGDNSTAAAAPKNKLYYNSSDAGATTETGNITISGPTYDIEGLAGNCLRFDGSDDYITYNPSSGNTFTDITDFFTFVVHIVPDIDISGATNTIFSSDPLVVNFNASTSSIEAKIHQSSANYVLLSSSALTVDGNTPTNVIVTLDSGIIGGNCKLFINGKLEDQTGIKIQTMASGANNNWQTGACAYITTANATVGASSNSFDGRIEEVVLYNKTLYPVVPSDTSFVLTKALKEISNGMPISYSARLFVKDYHNIRGASTTDISTSPSVSWRKAAFRLGD